MLDPRPMRLIGAFFVVPVFVSVAAADIAQKPVSNSVVYRGDVVYSGENGGTDLVPNPPATHDVLRYGQQTTVVVQEKSVINQIAFSPDNKKLAVACLEKVCNVYDPDKPLAAPLQTVRHQASVNAVVFSPTDPDILVTGDAKGVITVSGRPDITTKNTDVSYLVFVDDNTIAASSSKPNDLVMLRHLDGTDAGTVPGSPNGVTALAISPDLKMLAVGASDNNGNGTVTLYTLTKQNDKYGTNQVWTQTVPGGEVGGLSFEPNGGKRIAVGTKHPYLNPVQNIRNVQLLCISDGSQDSILQQYVGPINSVTFRSDAKELASGGQDDAHGQVREQAPAASQCARHKKAK